MCIVASGQSPYKSQALCNIRLLAACANNAWHRVHCEVISMYYVHVVVAV